MGKRKPVFVYGLFDPRAPEVIMYVGQSYYDPRERLKGHIGEAKFQTAYVNTRQKWIRSLLKASLEPGVRTLEFCPDKATANQREQYWVAVWEEKNPLLCNTGNESDTAMSVGLSLDWDSIVQGVKEVVTEAQQDGQAASVHQVLERGIARGVKRGLKVSLPKGREPLKESE